MRPVPDDVRELVVECHENRFVPRSQTLLAVWSLLNVPRISFLISRFAPDILHAHDVFCYGPFAYFSGYKYIVTPWGSDVLVVPTKSRILAFAIRLIIKRAALLLCEGGAFLSERLTELGASPPRTKTFFFGVDTSFFKPDEEARRIRTRLGIDEGTVIISTRRLKPIYDIPTLLRAAVEVLKHHPKTTFIIAGSGPEAPKLQSLAMRFGLGERVIFTGAFSRDEVRELLAASDIYVSTALSDSGIAISTLEAMSSGLPAIVTDFGDNSAWIREGENGFLFKPEDHQDLAKKIGSLIENEAQRRVVGMKNRTVVAEKADCYSELEKVDGIYLSFLGS